MSLSLTLPFIPQRQVAIQSDNDDIIIKKIAIYIYIYIALDIFKYYENHDVEWFNKSLICVINI